jgi:hypothetical protein
LVVNCTTKMAGDNRRFIDKLFYLVPVNQWNAIAAIVIGGLVLGIGNTVLNNPAPQIDPEPAAVEPGDTPLTAKKRVTVPDAISKGNVFRKQRQNYVIPPPEPPPKPAPVAKVEKPVVDFKLVGTIISDPARIAILSADQQAVKRKPPKRAHISGAAAILAAKKRAAKPPPVKTSDPQSFHEGDTVFDYVLERVYDDRIELVNLDSGESRVVYLVVEDASPSVPPAQWAVSDESSLKKDKAKPIKVSGAKTGDENVNK